MQTKSTAADNRKQLIKLVKGQPQYYYIDFSVDIRGNITIWGGIPLPDNATHDLFMHRATEQDLHLYDGWNRGAELSRMEQDAAENMPREELVQALLDFRKQHPHDGYGIMHDIWKKWCKGYPQDEMRGRRDDYDEVKAELRRRNRKYIAELYGEQLPEDFNFLADYEARMEIRMKAHQ